MYFRIDIPHTWPSEVADILNLCWKLDPFKRLTIADLTAKLNNLGELNESWTFPAQEDY